MFDVKQEADYTQVRGRIIEDSIDSYINHGNKYPYDMDDEGNFDAPVNWAVRASRGIIDEFMERNGFDEMLEDVSEGTRKDIIVNMSNIIMRVAKQALTSNNFSIGEIE